MSSPPKKMRKSGGGVATTALQNDSAQNLDDFHMDEEDPASLYEDEEGEYLIQSGYSILFYLFRVFYGYFIPIRRVSRW